MNKFIDTPFPFFLVFYFGILTQLGPGPITIPFSCSLVGKDLLAFTSLGARYHHGVLSLDSAVTKYQAY